MPQQQLQLFGSVQVSWEAGTPPRFRSQRTVALLGYLVAEARPFTRDHLAALFWPDEDLSKGKANLRRELHNLAQILPGCWQTNRVEVVFVSREKTVVDIYQFRQYEAARQWQAAADLFGGNFLEGIVLAENIEFESWLFGEQERWRQRAENVLTNVVNIYTQQANYKSALNFSRKLLQLIPWNETIHRQVMLLLARTGQHSMAIKQFETCRQILADELGIEPSIETAILFKRIWSAQSTPPYDLPNPPTAFIGRAAEITDIKQRLADSNCRLLTLVGPGGIGKTRLAIQIATKIKNDYLNRAVFIPLARVTSVDFLIPTIAESLRLKFHGQESPKNQLIKHLQERELLLIMDNFEHILAGADLLAGILRKTTDVKILVTSRQRLGLSGEWVYQIQGMDFSHETTKSTLTQDLSDAGQLFLQTARQLQADYQPSSDDILAIAQVCRIVEGMPLGLELAAAWTRALTCTEILREIEGDFQLLTTIQRDIPKRHQSLKAVFESSWNMLSKSQKEVFKKISVFRNGFRREAGEFVAEATFVDLAGLVDKSFLHLNDSGRYEIHELMRQFGAEKLSAEGDNVEKTQRRHSRYFGCYLQKREADLKGGQQKKALVEIDDEFDNIRAGWLTAIELKMVDTLKQSAWCLGHYFDFRGMWSEGYDLLGLVLTMLGEDADEVCDDEQAITFGRILVWQSVCSYRLGRYDEARDLSERGLSILQNTGYQGGIETAILWKNLGLMATLTGDYSQAEQHYAKALSVIKEAKDQWGTAVILGNIDNLARYRGDGLTVQEFSQKRLAICHQIDDRWNAAVALDDLGELALAQKDYVAAERYCREALVIGRDLKLSYVVAISLCHLGQAESGLGNYTAARNYLGQGLSLAAEIKAIPHVMEALTYFSILFMAEGSEKFKPKRIAEVLAFVLGHAATVPYIRVEARQQLAKVEAQLPPEVFERSIARGKAKVLDVLVAEILADTQKVLTSHLMDQAPQHRSVIKP